MPDADPGRWVTPTEIAEVVAFLLSPAASGVKSVPSSSGRTGRAPSAPGGPTSSAVFSDAGPSFASSVTGNR